MSVGGDSFWWFVILALGVLVLFVPQWISRRQQAKRIADFQPGDRVITIGGFIGTLSYIDLEENLARIMLAEGVEIELLPGAISRKLVRDDASAA